MKRNYLGYSYFVPFMLWSDLATKTQEMVLGSAQVIGHRTGRMALAGSTSTGRSGCSAHAAATPSTPPTFNVDTDRQVAAVGHPETYALRSRSCSWNAGIGRDQ
jgi:hypothetical protein